MVDTSSTHAVEERKDEGSECEEDDSEDKEEKEGEQRSEFAECKRSLARLFEEQLSRKNKVYILETADIPPTPLNFRKNKQRFAYYKNPPNPETNGIEKCLVVLIFCMQELFLGEEKLPIIVRCPWREGFLSSS